MAITRYFKDIHLTASALSLKTLHFRFKGDLSITVNVLVETIDNRIITEGIGGSRTSGKGKAK